LGAGQGPQYSAGAQPEIKRGHMDSLLFSVIIGTLIMVGTMFYAIVTVK
jgi:hypothetical protein